MPHASPPMRRPIAHLTGAAAVLAMLVAVSISLAPGLFSPSALPPAGSLPPASVAPPASALSTPGRSFGPIASSDGGGTVQPVDRQPATASQAAALKGAVERARLAFGLDAVAVGVSADARVGWSGASGAPRDGVTPLNGTTPFAIASVTKTFTAAIVLELVEEGRVKFDGAVTDYLPELTVALGVTVRELLSHTSGIADLLAPMRTRLNAEPSRVWQPEEVVALVGPSRFEPGTDWGYSNTNYLIAGMLIERVTGHAYADELERRITGPLKLLGTAVPARGGLPYLLGVSWTSAFGASAMLDSNAADLVRWGDALYGGAILRPVRLDRLLAFHG